MKVVRPAIDKSAAERLREQSLAVLTGGTGRANSETLKALDTAVERAVSVSEPCGGYRFARLTEITEAGVGTLFGPVESRKFSLMAGESSGERRIVFALATAGTRLDEELEGDMPLLDKFVLDAVGSELAEMIADLVEDCWKDEAAALGLESSVRMSPGYCDWHLQGQSLIFKAIDAEAVGVRLTGSFLMIPSKSVSSAAVVAERVSLKLQCVICKRADCPFRRAPYDEEWKSARAVGFEPGVEEKG